MIPVWFVFAILGCSLVLSAYGVFQLDRSRAADREAANRVIGDLLDENRKLIDRIIGLELMNSRDTATGLRYLNATLVKRSDDVVSPELKPVKYPDAEPLSLRAGLE